jgi:hypothetical protein
MRQMKKVSRLGCSMAGSRGLGIRYPCCTDIVYKYLPLSTFDVFQADLSGCGESSSVMFWGSFHAKATYLGQGVNQVSFDDLLCKDLLRMTASSD